MALPYELMIGLRYTRAKRRNHFISFISLISMLGIALGVTALNMVAVLRGDITGFISSTTDFVNFPSAFMNDIQSALSLQSSAAMSSISSVGEN